MSLPAAPTTRVPEDLTGALVELLVERHRAGIVAALLALIGPHVAPRPRLAGLSGDAPVLVDVALFRRLMGLTGPGWLLVDVLDVVEPWLTQPQHVDEYATPTPDDPTPDDPAGVTLSSRETEVLAGMAAGRSNAAIARDLYLSEHTIKSHAQRLFRKLDATDRAHAVRRGFDLGLLTPATLDGDQADAQPAQVA